MAENTPPTPEEIQRLNRDLMEKVLDRAASDPEWKQRLLDDPGAAIVEADFPEARRLREAQASMEAEEVEVAGQQMIPPSACYISKVCNATVMVDYTLV